MFEKGNEFDGRDRLQITRRAVGALAVAGAIFVGMVKYAPWAEHRLAHILYKDSTVLAGVTGQVENHDYNRVFTGKFWVHNYLLAIEQCPADVDAAIQGDHNQQSFDSAVGVVAPGCTVDWVKVSRGTYKNYAAGDLIVLEGKPTEHLMK